VLVEHKTVGLLSPAGDSFQVQAPYCGVAGCGNATDDEVQGILLFFLRQDFWDSVLHKQLALRDADGRLIKAAENRRPRTGKLEEYETGLGVHMRCEYTHSKKLGGASLAWLISLIVLVTVMIFSGLLLLSARWRAKASHEAACQRLLDLEKTTVEPAAPFFFFSFFFAVLS
jgi:hypothetical protein